MTNDQWLNPMNQKWGRLAAFTRIVELHPVTNWLTTTQRRESESSTPEA